MQNFISVRSTCILVVWNRKLPFTMKTVNFSRNKWHLMVCFPYVFPVSILYKKVWLFDYFHWCVYRLFTAYIGYFRNCFAYVTASIGKSWKRYIPSKMSRFGMKLRVLREGQSGYIWNFCIYLGTDTDHSQNYPKYKITICIVLELCRYLFITPGV